MNQYNWITPSNLLALLLLLFSSNSFSEAVIQVDNIPLFEARYEVRMNGLVIAKASFSQKKIGERRYHYVQKTKAKGLVSFFRRETVTEQTTWDLTETGIRPIEYDFRKLGGSDDEHKHIVFDWENLRAENTGETEPWKIDIETGTLDKLLVQVAMLLDIQAGKTVFNYPIADNGRLKHYQFARISEEPVEVPGGLFQTTKLQRMDDDRDITYIWTAPTLKYLPVRFLKIKKSGLKLEIRLKEIQMQNPA
ncbi:MAG: DUF3108 domain-containing protein [Gammaproteobacteria bacterium]